jgi:NADH-quinone oxidoreductase subunit M
MTLIIGAAYTLWLVKRVIFGEVANEHVKPNSRTSMARMVLGVFAAGVLLIGVCGRQAADRPDGPASIALRRSSPPPSCDLQG